MVLQVREAHADEADLPTRYQDLSEQQLAQDQDRLEVRGVDLQTPGPSVDFEIRIFGLQGHGAERILLQSQLLVEGLHQGFEFGPERVVAREVVLERRLRADRLRRTTRLDDLSGVTAHRDVVYVFPEGPEEFDEVLTIVSLYVPNRLETEFLEPVGGLRADAQDLPDRERGEEFHDMVRLHDREAIGFLEIGGDLRGRLRGSDADRAGESLLLPDCGLDFQGELAGPTVVAAAAARHIQVALLDPRRLKMVGEAP